MDNMELAAKIMALGIGEPLGLDAVFYPDDNNWIGVNKFVRDPRVAMALMEKVYEKQYSFMVMQLPDKKPMMTIQAPIQTAGEYADPSTRNSWASQITNESLPRAITEACVEALS